MGIVNRTWQWWAVIRRCVLGVLCYVCVQVDHSVTLPIKQYDSVCFIGGKVLQLIALAFAQAFKDINVIWSPIRSVTAELFPLLEQFTQALSWVEWWSVVALRLNGPVAVCKILPVRGSIFFFFWGGGGGSTNLSNLFCSHNWTESSDFLLKIAAFSIFAESHRSSRSVFHLTVE